MLNALSMPSRTPASAVQLPPAPSASRSSVAAPRHRAGVPPAEGIHVARIAGSLKLLDDALQPHKRIVRAGDVIYRAGQRFDCLHVLNSGMVKVVKSTPDGREQVVGLKFRGDWLGLDGIARGAYGCDGIAMDTGEVWAISYDHLLRSCARVPTLMTTLHDAMSLEIARDRDSLMSVCTLPADARVADFLRFIAESLSARGMRTDQITLRMTRAEIGNYLGLTLETVSRALSRLVRDNIISFVAQGRRDVCIPDLQALSAFVQHAMSRAPTLVQ